MSIPPDFRLGIQLVRETKPDWNRCETGDEVTGQQTPEMSSKVRNYKRHPAGHRRTRLPAAAQRGRLCVVSGCLPTILSQAGDQTPWRSDPLVHDECQFNRRQFHWPCDQRNYRCTAGLRPAHSFTDGGAHADRRPPPLVSRRCRGRTDYKADDQGQIEETPGTVLAACQPFAGPTPDGARRATRHDAGQWGIPTVGLVGGPSCHHCGAGRRRTTRDADVASAGWWRRWR
jgi:hypothetical protein